MRRVGSIDRVLAFSAGRKAVGRWIPRWFDRSIRGGGVVFFQSMFARNLHICMQVFRVLLWRGFRIVGGGISAAAGCKESKDHDVVLVAMVPMENICICTWRSRKMQ